MADYNTYTLPESTEKQKVIAGNARIDKPSMSKRVINLLFSDKIDSVANYLAYYILGPSLKDLVFKMGTGALQMALFGGQGNSQYPPMGWSNNGWNNGYNSARRDPYMYNQVSNPGYAQPQPGFMAQRLTLNDISFDTKDDAWTVLDRMNREIGRYGKVRAADFYTFAGITGQESNWTLQGNGWYDLNQAHPMMRTDGRWIIDFPPAVNLR